MQCMENLESHEKTEKNIDALDKMAEFVEFHGVDPNILWDGEQIISPYTFIERMERYLGYSATIQEINAILHLCESRINGLKVQYLWEYGLWKGQEINLNVQTKKQSRIKKATQKRPLTATYTRNHTKMSEITQFRQSKVTNKQNYASMMSVSRGLQNSRSSRQKKIEKSLEEQIINNALEKKWEYLLKVGEMNSWMQKKIQKNVVSDLKGSQQPPQPAIIQQPQNYRVISSDHDLQIICENHNNSGEQQLLPLKVFDQRYQAERKKNIPMQKHKNNMKGTMMMVLDSHEKFTKAKLHQKIFQRDQELNYILLQIMRNKNVLEQQESVLAECKINYL